MEISIFHPSGARLVEPAAAWLCYFVLCFLAAFHSGFDAQLAYDPGESANNQYLPLGATTAEVTDRYGGKDAGKYRGGDLASYLAAGEELLAGNRFEREYTDHWPPAMPFVIAALIGVTGTSAYPLKMVLLSVLVWSLALAFAFAAVRPFVNRYASFAIFAALLVLPSLRAWIFGFGAVMSESLSHAFFFMSVCALVSALPRKNVRRFALAGALMGVATLFRAYFEYVGNFVFGGAAALLFVAMIVSFLRGGRSLLGLAADLWKQLVLGFRQGPRRTPALAALLACWLAAFVAFAVVVLPWRAYKLARFDTGKIVSTTPGFAFSHAWLRDDQQPSFFRGGNVACHTDASLCDVVQREAERLTLLHKQKLALMTFFFRPRKWISLKLQHFDWLWFGRDISDVLTQPLMLVEGVLLLLFGFAGATWLAILAIRRRAAEFVQLAWVTAAFTAWNVAFFTLYTLEWRYSLASRIFAFLLPIFVLAVERRSRPESEQSTPPPAPLPLLPADSGHIR